MVERQLVCPASAGISQSCLVLRLRRGSHTQWQENPHAQRYRRVHPRMHRHQGREEADRSSETNCSTVKSSTRSRMRWESNRSSESIVRRTRSSSKTGDSITILFHNAHLSMLLKGISFPDLEAILWGASGSAGRDQGSDSLLGTRVLNG